MLGRKGRRALSVAFFLIAGCGGGGAEPVATPSDSAQSQPDFSNEFVGGIGPEERAWLERQRREANGSA